MKTGISPKDIGKRIRAIRRRAALRAVDVAAALNITRQHIYHIENGDRGVTLERLQQFSRVLKVDVATLLKPYRQ